VVGFDFGTNYSGFSYYNVDKQDEYSDNPLLKVLNSLNIKEKVPTLLQYDDVCNYVTIYNSLLMKLQIKPVELFKLHLGDLPDNLKPKLPIEYKKAITDYLKEIGKVYIPIYVIINVK